MDKNDDDANIADDDDAAETEIVPAKSFIYNV